MCIDLVDRIVAYEQGDMSQEETLRLFQELIDTGLAFRQQGQYGRTATSLSRPDWCDQRRKRSRTRNQGDKNMILRETLNFVAQKSKRGVRITVKDKRNMPASRVVTEATWQILQQMNDASFDGSCVMELGIGTYQRSNQWD